MPPTSKINAQIMIHTNLVPILVFDILQRLLSWCKQAREPCAVSEISETLSTSFKIRLSRLHALEWTPQIFVPEPDLFFPQNYVRRQIKSNRVLKFGHLPKRNLDTCKELVIPVQELFIPAKISLYLLKNSLYLVDNSWYHLQHHSATTQNASKTLL